MVGVVLDLLDVRLEDAELPWPERGKRSTTKSFRRRLLKWMAMFPLSSGFTHPCFRQFVNLLPYLMVASRAARSSGLASEKFVARSSTLMTPPFVLSPIPRIGFLGLYTAQTCQESSSQVQRCAAVRRPAEPVPMTAICFLCMTGLARLVASIARIGGGGIVGHSLAERLAGPTGSRYSRRVVMPIDRRTVLSSTLAWAALTLSGCSDSDGSGGAAGAGGGGGVARAAAPAARVAGGGAYTCATTMTGSHMHPLTIPSSDIERGYYDAPYVLQDGGTGHTHELELTGYDFAYFQAGVTVMADSTTTNGHLHTCSDHLHGELIRTGRGQRAMRAAIRIRSSALASWSSTRNAPSAGGSVSRAVIVPSGAPTTVASRNST